MSKDLQDFKRFMEQREAAAGAYVRGDAEPLGQMVARVSNASFFSPRGDYVTGADAVWSRYEEDAGAFDSGSDNRFEILDMGASDEIAYWVGLQRASAQLRGNPEPVEFNLRITEIFRREGDEWKLVHRHADQLASEADEKQSAE